MRFTFRFLTEQYATEADLKKAYRKLAKKYHPDNGGSLEDSQQLNAEYDRLMKRFEADRKRAAEEEARKKAAEEAAKKRAEKTTKKTTERKPTKTQRVKDDLLNRLKGEKFEFYKGGHSHEAIRWRDAEFVITSLGVDIYFKNKETCAKAIEIAKKYTFFQTSKYRKCVCWVKALKDDALTEVLNALR